MEALFTFCKENYQLITLLVALAGVVVACISLVNEINKRKRKNNNDEK